MAEADHDYLRRLPPEYYRGLACVSWTYCIEGRRCGWLNELFHARFREYLTHTMFRYSACCPIYCLMPDHFHLLWFGLSQTSDQRLATRYFRKHLNRELTSKGFSLQPQPYDHVLREDERQDTAFRNTAEYIARNPERNGLVPPDSFREYEFSGCLVPGYPDLSPFQAGFCDLFDRLCS